MNYQAAMLQERGKRSEQQDGIVLVDTRILCVADGMGGYNGGAVASAEMCAAVNDVAALAAEDFGNPNIDRFYANAWLETTFETGNRRICDRKQADLKLRKMGTTCVLALRIADTLYFGNLGDSRAALWRDGKLTKLTTEHVVMRHYLTRYVGHEPMDMIEYGQLNLQAGDIIVVSSDGLHGYVAEEKIADCLTKGGTAAELCAALLAEANAVGAPDNVSVVVLRCSN